MKSQLQNLLPRLLCSWLFIFLITVAIIIRGAFLLFSSSCRLGCWLNCGVSRLLIIFTVAIITALLHFLNRCSLGRLTIGNRLLVLVVILILGRIIRTRIILFSFLCCTVPICYGKLPF